MAASPPDSAPAPTPSTGPATQAPSLGLPCGHRLREFVLLREIGEGGFGIVYLARDERLQREVAIKEYMPASLAMRHATQQVSMRSERHRASFEQGLRSFLNEARMLASFDHPALVRIHDWWEDNGTAYMVMPYYEGPTLGRWLKRQPHPPEEDRLKALVAPLTDALSRLHDQGCCHRDIAADNILLVGPEERPVLLDFGAARYVALEGTQALTSILKPGYAPIEQYANVSQARQGPWTDVYALCAVLHLCITGRVPSPAVGRLLHDDVQPLVEAARGRYSPSFLQAIDDGLAIHPKDRIADMATLRARLLAPAPDAHRASLYTQPPASMVSPPPDSQGFGETTVIMDETAQRRHRRPTAEVTRGAWPWAWVAGGILLTVLVGLTWV